MEDRLSLMQVQIEVSKGSNRIKKRTFEVYDNSGEIPRIVRKDQSSSPRISINPKKGKIVLNKKNSEHRK